MFDASGSFVRIQLCTCNMITFYGPVLEDKSIVLDAGDDYTHASRKLEWTLTNWDGPNVDGVTAELRFLPLVVYEEYGDQSEPLAVRN